MQNPNSMTSIIEIKNYSTEYHEAMQRFLNQLTTHPMVLTENMFLQLLDSPNSHLFFIMKDEQIAGMLTIGIYYSPTGGKAWIEDVVVDESFRGQGLSKLLVAQKLTGVGRHGTCKYHVKIRNVRLATYIIKIVFSY